MDKRKWLVEACKAKMWRFMRWRLSLFTVGLMPESELPIDYDINYIDGWAHTYLNGEWVKLDGTKQYEGIFNSDDILEISGDDFPKLEGTIKTTVGRYFINWLTIYYPFEGRLPYEPNKIDPSAIASRIEPLVRPYDEEFDEPLPAGVKEEDVLRPRHVANFVQSIQEYTSLCLGVAATPTIERASAHPDLYKIRDALLLKHKDELDDISVIVEIQSALDALEKEWLAGDQSIDFYSSKKSMERRRKMLLIYGIETSFKENDEYELIPTSLVEKPAMDKLVAKFNSIRSGSYFRGAETAKGGDKVRVLQTIFQNHLYVAGDCGTKATHNVLLNSYNYDKYVGLNVVEKGKPLTPATKDYLKDHIGKIVSLRRPILCHQPHIDFCEHCANTKKLEERRSIPADVSNGASRIMYGAMSAMHGQSVDVHEFEPTLHID